MPSRPDIAWLSLCRCNSLFHIPLVFTLTFFTQLRRLQRHGVANQQFAITFPDVLVFDCHLPGILEITIIRRFTVRHTTDGKNTGQKRKQNDAKFYQGIDRKFMLRAEQQTASTDVDLPRRMITEINLLDHEQLCKHIEFLIDCLQAAGQFR